MELYHGYRCACGKIHDAGIDRVICRRGAVEEVAAEVRRYGGSRVFVLCDGNTYKVGGERVKAILESAGIPVSLLILPSGIMPDERAAGYALMGFDKTCDLIVGVGSGVINDLGKLLSSAVKTPYFIVATAPSMDGYASATSSVEFKGLKQSLSTRCPNVVIGDLDILAKAPEHMLISGLGDMLAKYVSVTEWRISNLINNEYYCENVAKAVRESLAACVSNAKGLLSRDYVAIEAVFLGLVQSGAAMNYAGLSRPASGVEHYFSHIWDMRGLAFGTPVDLHGIQCAVGTVYAARIYDFLLNFTPDKERALASVASFDRDAWFARLRAFVGPGADAMIEAEKKDRKYDPVLHAERLDRIISLWDEIRKIIKEEMPHESELLSLLRSIGAPTSSEELGHKKSDLPVTFSATKDIRDKYVLSRLVWDLGLNGEAEKLLLK